MIHIALPNHFRVRSTEWMTACMKASFGFILLAVPTIFRDRHMVAMQQIAPQTTWGLIGLIAGLVHLCVLYINGHYRKSPHWRAFCSGVGVIFWFEVTLGIYGATSPTTGMAIYPWMVIFSVYNVVCAMGDARQYDDGEAPRHAG